MLDYIEGLLETVIDMPQQHASLVDSSICSMMSSMATIIDGCIVTVKCNPLSPKCNPLPTSVRLYQIYVPNTFRLPPIDRRHSVGRWFSLLSV